MELSPETVAQTLDAVGVRWPADVARRLSSQIESPMSYRSMSEEIESILADLYIRASSDQIRRASTSLVDALREAQPPPLSPHGLQDRGAWASLTVDQRRVLMEMESVKTRLLRLFGSVWLLGLVAFGLRFARNGDESVGPTVAVFVVGVFVTFAARAVIAMAHARRAKHILGSRSLLLRMMVVAARGWRPPLTSGVERGIFRATQAVYVLTVVAAAMLQIAVEP